jgi:hypothetical protein
LVHDPIVSRLCCGAYGPPLRTPPYH